jgi:DNA-binding transcriptional LysR family regulator
MDCLQGFGVSEGENHKISKTSTVRLSANNLDWDDLKIFMAVADAGQIKAAAENLGMVRSAVSKRIDDFESRLGTTLFNRVHGQGMALTDDGLMVKEHAALMSRAMQSLVRQTGARDKRQEGRVTIEAPDGVATYWLAPHLAAFQRENPKISVALDCGFWASAPLPDPTDLVITMKEEKRLDYVAVPLAVLHYVLFASPTYLAAYGAPTSLANIAEHRFLDFTPISEQPENWHPKAAALRSLLSFGLETNSSSMLFETLRAGGGLAVAPTAVKSFAPELVMVYPEPMSHIKLWMVYHRDAMDKARVRTTADWIKSIFDGRKFPWFREDFVHPDTFEKA